MNNYLFILIFGVLFIFETSCGTILSDLDQITAQRQKCDVNKSQADYYEQKYGSHFTKTYARKAVESLSNVPEEYLDNVFSKHNAKVEVVSEGGTFYSASHGSYLCGYASISKDSSGSTRTVGNIRATVECLPHEFGHDTFSYLSSRDENFYSELKKVSYKINASYRSKVSAYLNKYSDASYWRLDETLAELFDSWYCSEKSREIIKRDMPEVYTFASNYLLPPEGLKRDINLYIANNGANSKIYFANNKSTESVSYCITNSSSEECSNPISTTSFNKSGKNNIFVSQNINLSNKSSFVLLVYIGNTLARKVTISK